MPNNAVNALLLEYIQRTYRNHFRQDRWKSFVAKYKETDLWIGVDPKSFQKEMLSFTDRLIRRLRIEMEAYLGKDPDYARSLMPYSASPDAPSIFRAMSAVAAKSGIGPMSAVAGAIACKVGEALKAEFEVQEVIVENGGDIYADIIKDMDISVFAGNSPLSEKVGLHIEASEAPLGICTSSGTVGPSLSFGKADAVMIVCHDTLLSDTYATAFANTVQTADDIDRCLEKIRTVHDILAALIIKDDKMGICGKFGLKIF